MCAPALLPGFTRTPEKPVSTLAPLLFAGASRLGAAQLPPAPVTMTAQEVARHHFTAAHGVSLIPIGRDRVAVRFGPVASGMTAYTDTRHGLAFVQAVILFLAPVSE